MIDSNVPTPVTSELSPRLKKEKIITLSAGLIQKQAETTTIILTSVTCIF
jgi:hypothetical protein